jgi:hypothetical protein
MLSSVANPHLLRPASLFLSATLLAVVVLLYTLGSGATGTRSLVFEALFWFTLALLFLGARRFSRSIVAFAAVRWLSESWATFAKQYRTTFFGVLCLCALAATVFELVVGTKITQFLGGAA